VATVVRKLSKNIVTLKEAATELGVGVKVLETTMNYAKGNELNVSLMEASEFSAKYGDDVQAVTLLKSGQGGKVNVEVISSKGATQEARQAALAEEFVHLQQLANPVMRAKMLKLSEENLASWPQMSQAGRVDLIQTKLEVEADAQKILLKEGGPNVDRAMAQEHLTNIEEKLGGLDKATQAGRVPEWIERADAPRLFSKEGEEASKSAASSVRLVDDFIQGSASVGNRNVKWTRNTGNIGRTKEQVIDLLDKLDLYTSIEQSVPNLHKNAWMDIEDINWHATPSRFFENGQYAMYRFDNSGAGNEIIHINDLFRKGLKPAVSFRDVLLKVDDGLVDTLSHEYYELVCLKSEFLNNGGSLRRDRIQSLIETDLNKMHQFGMSINLHTQAHQFSARVTASFQSLVKKGDIERF
jgi:hypothetical protein